MGVESVLSDLAEGVVEGIVSAAMDRIRNEIESGEQEQAAIVAADRLRLRASQQARLDARKHGK